MRGPRSNLTTSEDSQPMISCRLASHIKPLGPKISTFHDFQRNARDSQLVFFQNEAQNIPSQDFVMMNISCEFEISTYNTFCSGGPTKVLAESRKKTPVVAILFFKMRPKIFPGKFLWL